MAVPKGFQGSNLMQMELPISYIFLLLAHSKGHRIPFPMEVFSFRVRTEAQVKQQPVFLHFCPLNDKMRQHQKLCIGKA